MGEILGLGVTHSPLFPQPAENMAFLLRKRLADPDIPAEAKDQSKWPDAMRAEWGSDGGAAAGAKHREEMIVGLRRARQRLDEFKPDFILMWGDDQYENFREDIIPPFSILAYEQVVARPWAHAAESSAMKGKPNIWGEAKSPSNAIARPRNTSPSTSSRRSSTSPTPTSRSITRACRTRSSTRSCSSTTTARGSRTASCRCRSIATAAR
jgi:hypothetical protein